MNLFLSLKSNLTEWYWCRLDDLPVPQVDLYPANQKIRKWQSDLIDMQKFVNQKNGVISSNYHLYSPNMQLRCPYVQNTFTQLY